MFKRIKVQEKETVDNILISFYTIKDRLLDLIDNKVVEENSLTQQKSQIEEDIAANIEEQKKAKTAVNQLNKILGE